MALRFLLKKSPSALARSGALLHACATAAAAPAAQPLSGKLSEPEITEELKKCRNSEDNASSSFRVIEGGVRTLTNVFHGVVRPPSPVITNNSGIYGLVARHVNTLPCRPTIAKIRCSRTACINRGKQTFWSSARNDHKLYAGSQLSDDGADFERVMRYIRRMHLLMNFLIVCAVSLRLYRTSRAVVPLA